MALLNYKGNESHYKGLISRINSEVNFPAYLSSKGYKLKQKSASYLEFVDNEDKLVIKVSVTPNTYFNRNDSTDNGLFFNYLSKRSENFYDTIQLGLEIINSVYEVSTLEIVKTTKKNKNLEENYNITKTLVQRRYLVKDRAISESTLNSRVFKGRILNAYHKNQNSSAIPNIAFPLFDDNNQIKNYRLYNKAYLSKTTGKVEKFRIVLNPKNGHYLFYSNPNLPKIEAMYLAENEIDALSYYELKKDNKALYIGLGGGLSKEKKEHIMNLFYKVKENQNVPRIVSITDNDIMGLHFDLELSAYIISNQNDTRYVEYKKHNTGFDFIIHYHTKLKAIALDYKVLKKSFGLLVNQDKTSNFKIELILFKDKIKWAFINPLKTPLTPKVKQNILKALELVNKHYNPIEFKTDKSALKDWNDDLKLKKEKQLNI